MITDIIALLKRAKECGLNLSTDQADFDRSGLDFYVLHATDHTGQPWIVRTPRHSRAYETSLTEAETLKHLRPHLNVSLPDWRIQEHDMIAYPRLPGTPAWTYDPEKGLTWNGIDVSDPQFEFLQSTAAFLARLHQITPQDVNKLRVQSMDEVRQSIQDACVATRAYLQPTEALWQRWQRWLADDTYWPQTSAFAHGDFHPGHMLLDKSLRLIGVLDWTEADFADPTVDFGIFYGCFGIDHLVHFLRLYQEAGGIAYERMAEHVIERWAAYAPLVAQWGLKNDQPSVIEHAKRHLITTETQMLATNQMR